MSPDTENSASEKPEEIFRLQRSCARAFAIQFLYQLDIQRSWDCTPEAISLFRENWLNIDNGFPKKHHRRAWSYATRLIEGVCEHHTEIDQLLNDAAENWVLSRISSVDLSILRLGTFEIAFSEKISPATAINEAIELAKKFGVADSPRFINGVLDKVRKNHAGGSVAPPIQ